MCTRLIRLGFSLLAVLLVALAAPSAAVAQITGVVVDGSGASVPNARVTAGGSTGTTGDDGTFEFPTAPDGTVVEVAAQGFSTQSVTARVGTRVRVVLFPARLEAEVVVTASRGGEGLATASATTVVTSAELLASGAGSLDDALRNTPGFSLFRRSSSRVANPTTQGVQLRGVSGSGASRTKVIVDGLPLNDPFGSWVYWNRVPQTAIERIEVLRGATGDLYGADALGGVIQVLTFQPNATRLRVIGEGGSHSTARFSGFGSMQRDGWFGEGSGEWLRTDGVFVLAEDERGSVDERANSDYTTGFFGGGFNAGDWNASGRLNIYDENRGNGTELQVNSTSWWRLSGTVSGAAPVGAWTANLSFADQDYFQTFSAVAGDRNSERLVKDQQTPTTSFTGAAQWSGAFEEMGVLLGLETLRSKGTLEDTGRSFATGAPLAPNFFGGTETNTALFGRVSLVPQDDFTVVVGVRADFWRSSPNDPGLAKHSSNFFSPRASAAWNYSDEVTVQAAVYRAYRTPTLNELHRGFRVGDIVTTANPELNPERLTGFEGGVLYAKGMLSARVTAFWNQLDDAITNVTIGTTPALITRQRQNTDTVRASGLEFEADYQPHPEWTMSALFVATRSIFSSAPAQPDIEGNSVPQVPIVHVGGSVTYANPRGFTGAMQIRAVGRQFDDDRNVFELETFGVVDLTVSQEVSRGVNVYAAFENLFDTEYDVGRTPRRTIGYPRTFRMGARVFLP